MERPAARILGERVEIAEANIRIDAATADVLRALDAEGVEPRLLKGRSIGGWLYSSAQPRHYGDYQNLGDRYRNVVGIFMNQAMRGKPLTIFGDGSRPGRSATSMTWPHTSRPLSTCRRPTIRCSTWAPTRM